MLCADDGKRGFVFLGETGSGKTELSVNLALRLARERSGKVCFFDMDQTKGLFRSRDLKDVLEAGGVDFCSTTQFMDSPVIPDGVSGALESETTLSVFDVGGNAVGARMVGQFARYMDRCEVFYVVNPHRPFSSEAEDMLSGLNWILHAARLDAGRVKVISNPCLGRKTAPENILPAHSWLCSVLEPLGMSPAALAAEEGLETVLAGEAGCPVFPIKLYVRELYDT